MRYINQKGLRDWSLNGTSGDNAAQTLTKTAEVGKRHIITSYSVALRNGGGESTIQIKSGVTVIWTDSVVRDERAEHTFPHGLLGQPGELVSITVSAPGSAGSYTEANMEGASTG